MTDYREDEELAEEMDLIQRADESRSATGYVLEHIIKARTLGEFQGEFQFPPESLRIGRRVRLTDTKPDGDAVYDETAGMWVQDATEF